MPVRLADAGDVDAIIELVREFAAFEGDPLVDGPDRAQFAANLSGPRPIVEAFLAESSAGVPVGFALFSPRCNPGTGRLDVIYLSDLFVREAFRGHGWGRALMAALARLAAERGCTRIDWSVLHENTSAIAFYRSLGATPMDDRVTYRLNANAIARLRR